MPIKLWLFVVVILGGLSREAAAECPDDFVDCGTGACCPRTTPVCCPFVCCGSNGRCSADGFSCVPLDDEEPAEEEDVPTLPTCEEGQVVALNRCAPTAPGTGSGSAVIDDACGCTTTCASNADCATGCCNQGYCALACVCSGGASVSLSPSPEACQMAGGTSVEPINAPPIGGFGGSGCGVGGGSPAAITLVGFALAAGLLRRRRR